MDERSSRSSQGCVGPNLGFSWHIHKPCRCHSVSLQRTRCRKRQHSFCIFACSHTSVGHSGPNALLPLSGAAPQHNQHYQCSPTLPLLSRSASNLTLLIAGDRRFPVRIASLAQFSTLGKCAVSRAPMCRAVHIISFLFLFCFFSFLTARANRSTCSRSRATRRLFGRARVSRCYRSAGIVFGRGFGQC